MHCGGKEELERFLGFQTRDIPHLTARQALRPSRSHFVGAACYSFCGSLSRFLEKQSVSARWLSALPVVGLTLLFFAPLVAHPDCVLYSDHSDLLAEHLPAKRFLVRSWKQ